MKANSVKEKIASGRKAIGFTIPFPSLQIVELMGGLGFDFVFIEGEHGAFSPMDIEQICIVADRMGMTPIARVPDIRPPTILGFLDRGVKGIMGPHVKTKADAEMLVKACKFAPEGIRSFYCNRVANYVFPEDIPGYMAQANADMLVCALVEDEEAMENLPDILNVEGLDVVTIGYVDLSQSMGEPGNYEHPRVKAAMDKAIGQIRASSKVYGPDVMSVAYVSRLLKQGGSEYINNEKAMERS